MLIKMIASAVGIAGISLAGSALADTDLSTLAGISAEPMTVVELDATRGARNIKVVPPDSGQAGTKYIIDGSANSGAAHEAVSATQNGKYTIQFE